MATSVIPKSLASDVNTLNSRLEVVFGSVQVTLPNGQTTATETIVNLSSYIPSGKTLYAIIPLQLGNYPLPYFDSNGNPKTFLQWANAGTGSVTIKNMATAWNDYPFTFVLIVG